MKILALAALLLAAADLRADIVTVGPEGFARIEDALAHALAAPGSIQDIRIAEGTYATRLALPPACCAGKTLIVRGGWNGDFTALRTDPSLTVVDAGLLGRVLDIPSMTSGTVVLQNLTIQHGRVKASFVTFGAGAGIRAMLSGSARLVLNAVHVRSNDIAAIAIGPGPGGVMSEARGAGIYAQLSNAAVLQVDRSEIADNSISSDALPDASGAGIHLQLLGGTAAVRSSRFAGNRISGPVATTGGDALLGHVNGTAQLTVSETVFEGASSTSGSTAEVSSFGSGTGTAAWITRCRFLGNSTSRQLAVRTFGTRRILVADTLVANGRSEGVSATAWSGTIHLTNLTVTGQRGAGIRTSPSVEGTITLHNSIAWQNTPNLAGALSVAGSNRIGVDPLFVDPAAGDFGLTVASPMIDVGNNAPPAGLGTRDLAGNPRVANGRVDVGAFERAH